MAKLIKPLAFRAILFADGPKGSYFQEWQCEKYPSLFIRITGKRGESKTVKCIFVRKPNFECPEFKSVEEALPTARLYNWNPYEKSDERRIRDDIKSGDHRRDRIFNPGAKTSARLPKARAHRKDLAQRSSRDLRKGRKK